MTQFHFTGSYLLLTMDEIKLTGLDKWVTYINRRISSNKNFLGVFVGQTGSGKSYGSIELADRLMHNNLPKENICFTAEQFLKRLDDGLKDNTLKKGDVLIWEETGIGLKAKDWQSKSNKIINSVIQVFRTENLIVIMNVPFLTFIDSDARRLIHAFFQTKRIDKKNKRVIVKPMNIQVNQISGKVYTKYLIARMPNGASVKVKTIALPKPRKELVDYYEEKSGEFKRNVITEARQKLDNLNKEDQIILSPVEKYYYNAISVEGKTIKEACAKFGHHVKTGWEAYKRADRKIQRGAKI